MSFMPSIPVLCRQSPGTRRSGRVCSPTSPTLFPALCRATTNTHKSTIHALRQINLLSTALVDEIKAKVSVAFEEAKRSGEISWPRTSSYSSIFCWGQGGGDTLLRCRLQLLLRPSCETRSAKELGWNLKEGRRGARAGTGSLLYLYKFDNNGLSRLMRRLPV